MQPQMSHKTKLAIRKLASERATGLYRHDLQGFIAEVQKLMKTAEAKNDEGGLEPEDSYSYEDTLEDLFR